VEAPRPTLDLVDGLELRALTASSPESTRAAADAYGVEAAPGGIEELAAEDRDLALKPLLRIVVQRDGSGHHAGNDRRGSQMHKYVAPGVEDVGLCLREAASVRNGAGGRR
jgi:hypothetical protein